MGLGDRGGMDDGVTVVMVNGERMEMRMWRDVARRGDGGVTVTMPAGWSGEEVWCYVMVSRDGEWSESECVGCVSGAGSVALTLEEGDGAGDEVVVDGNLNGMGSEEVCFGLDQSAIKVLSDSGQRCVAKGEKRDAGRRRALF